MEMQIDTAEPKRLLCGLNLGSSHLREFCRLLSIRLGDKTTPLNFLLVYSLLVGDIENSTDRSVGSEESFLAGLPIGSVLNLVQIKIIKGIFPADFAEQTLKERAEMLATVAGLVSK